MWTGHSAGKSCEAPRTQIHTQLLVEEVMGRSRVAADSVAEEWTTCPCPGSRVWVRSEYSANTEIVSDGCNTTVPVLHLHPTPYTVYHQARCVGQTCDFTAMAAELVRGQWKYNAGTTAGLRFGTKPEDLVRERSGYCTKGVWAWYGTHTAPVPYHCIIFFAPNHHDNPHPL